MAEMIVSSSQEHILYLHLMDTMALLVVSVLDTFLLPLMLEFCVFQLLSHVLELLLVAIL